MKYNCYIIYILALDSVFNNFTTLIYSEIRVIYHQLIGEVFMTQEDTQIH